jgi:hypothetical protein
MKRRLQTLIMRACPRCGGAAYLEDPDEQEWRCLQCARPVPLNAIDARRAQRRAA